SRRPARIRSCWRTVLIVELLRSLSKPHPHRITLERVLIQGDSEAWPVAEDELTRNDLWLLHEQHAPERVTDRVGKYLEDVPVLRGRDEMTVDLRVVVGRHQNAVRRSVVGDTEPLRDATRAGAVELEIADVRVVNQIATAEAVQLALATC